MNPQQLMQQNQHSIATAENLALLNNIPMFTPAVVDPNLALLMKSASSNAHKEAFIAALKQKQQQSQLMSAKTLLKEDALAAAVRNSEMATAPSSSIDEASCGGTSSDTDSDEEKDPRLASIKKAINKKKYALTSDDIRINLLDMVFNKKITIKKAAEKLGINYSTAKTILQIYKKEGRILKKSWSAKPFIPEMYGLAGAPGNRAAAGVAGVEAPAPISSIAASGLATPTAAVTVNPAASTASSMAAVAAAANMMASQNSRMQLSQLLASSNSAVAAATMMKNSLIQQQQQSTDLSALISHLAQSATSFPVVNPVTLAGGASYPLFAQNYMNSAAAAASTPTLSLQQQIAIARAAQKAQIQAKLEK